MSFELPQGTRTRPIAVLGAGTLGRRIALMLATRGAEVRLYDPNAPVCAAGAAYATAQLPDVLKVIEGGTAGTIVPCGDLKQALAAVWTSGRRADDDAEDWSRPADAASVPKTSIWSRSDGIVAWRNSVLTPGEQAENIAVYGSHLGLGANAAVLHAVADRLAQPEGAWRPFKAPAMLRAMYPKVDARSGP